MDEISPPEPSPLQAEQPQLSQPVLVREMLRSLHHRRGPALDLLQQVPVSPAPGSPAPDPAPRGVSAELSRGAGAPLLTHSQCSAQRSPASGGPKPQGHVPGVRSGSFPPGLPGPSPQSCSAAGTGAWGCSSPRVGLGIPLVELHEVPLPISPACPGPPGRQHDPPQCITTPPSSGPSTSLLRVLSPHHPGH